jgi:hypothetical protein
LRGLADCIASTEEMWSVTINLISGIFEFELTAIHQAELRANWEIARGQKPLLSIRELE